MLEGIEGWSSNEKASSVHAALESMMIALGEDINYDYLVGMSSLAFRMQIGGLCPSSPHPACGYKCIEYHTVMENFTGEYDSLKESATWIKVMYQDQLKRLEKAQPLEAKAINEIERVLMSI